MAKNMLELSIQGDVRRDAQRLWDTFESTLGQKGVRKLEVFATVNAARALAPFVREAAPDDHGLMKKSVRGRRSRYNKSGAIVGPVAGKKAAWYAWFVVRGTKPHRIPKLFSANTLKLKHGLKYGWNVFNHVDHPGVTGNNFVDRAVEQNLEKGRDAFGATIALMFRDEAFRTKVVGFEVAYKNKTAAQWQSQPWGRNWKNADYLDPIHAVFSERKDNTPGQNARLKLAGQRYDRYKAFSSGKTGVVPKIKNLEYGDY